MDAKAVALAEKLITASLSGGEWNIVFDMDKHEIVDVGWTQLLSELYVKLCRDELAEILTRLLEEDRRERSDVPLPPPGSLAIETAEGVIGCIADDTTAPVCNACGTKCKQLPHSVNVSEWYCPNDSCEALIIPSTASHTVAVTDHPTFNHIDDRHDIAMQ